MAFPLSWVLAFLDHALFMYIHKMRNHIGFSIVCEKLVSGVTEQVLPTRAAAQGPEFFPPLTVWVDTDLREGGLELVLHAGQPERTVDSSLDVSWQ